MTRIGSNKLGRARRDATVLVLAVAAGLAMAGCQEYDFVFIPNYDRQGAHLRFEVETPSKADFLFVVDNSRSMRAEQEALRQAFDALLQALAPSDTSYRIGIVSTDHRGRQTNCEGVRWADLEPALGPDQVPNGRGNRGDCTPELPAAQKPVLRRPHDGVAGRLVAAYVPEEFDVDADDAPELTAAAKQALARLYPDGPASHPDDANLVTGQAGVPWVIDRDVIQTDACNACGCEVCEKGTSCFAECAGPAAAELVRSYFSSNLRGLGFDGVGYESGLQQAMQAVGIAPGESDDFAVSPENGLSGPDSVNGHVGLDATGNSRPQSWLRDDALLAIMFLTDEEDCSMPEYLRAQQGQIDPEGAICYREDFEPQFFSEQRLAELLARKKAGESRVAVGFIGGVANSGGSAEQRRQGSAASCRPADGGAASTTCSCLFPGVGDTNNDGQVDPDEYLAVDDRWCAVLEQNEYTDNPAICDPDVGDQPCCHAMAGKRYVTFARQFTRRTFESVCRRRSAGCDADDPSTYAQCGFEPALRDFGQKALLACFDLAPEARPAGNDPELIEVQRAPRDAAAAGQAPRVLPRRQPGAVEPGWYYDGSDPQQPQVCLTGIDRLIGDVYDIFVMTRDVLNAAADDSGAADAGQTSAQ